LKDDPDVAPQVRDARGLQAPDLATKKKNAPLVDMVRCIKQLEERALAGTTWPRDKHELSSLYHQGKAAKDWAVASEGLVDVLENHDGPIGRTLVEAVARS
jgi:hypothetical protein